MTAKKDQKAQSKRFVEKAKELGADESGEAFERAMTTIAPPSKPKKQASPFRRAEKKSSS